LDFQSKPEPEGAGHEGLWLYESAMTVEQFGGVEVSENRRFEICCDQRAKSKQPAGANPQSSRLDDTVEE
jgi:hypothetical protein